MKGRIETGLRLAHRGRAELARTGSEADALRRFDWFYCGAEFCENLMEGPGWYQEEAAFFLEKGAKVCLLTPPVSEKGLKKLRGVLAALARLTRKNAGAAGRLEITVNDLGALQLALETGAGMTLNAGRLLYENLFFVDRTKMTLLNAEAVRLFGGFGLKRFELSTTGRKLRTNFPSARAIGFTPRDISLTLHYPYLNLSSARTCVTGMPELRPEDSADGIHCRRECGICSFEVDHPSVKERLLVAGNTVFLKFPKQFYKSGASLLQRRIDRLVYSPFP